MEIDLSTTYLGLKLANPIVVGACPLVGQLDVLRRVEEHGAAAAVLPSLFGEQLEWTGGGGPSLESTAYFHQLKQYNRGPDAYLKYLTTAKEAVSIPLVASINATAPGKWVHFARQIEDAGADALELNLFFLVPDFDTTSRELESRYVELVAQVRDEVSIPLAVKVGPFFTAFGNVARRLVEAGADGLVLFNRFLEPEIDLDQMRVVPRLALSSPQEMRVVLRWIALLHGRLDASLAATTGVHFADDAVRMVLAGADAVMVTSTLYRHGVDVIGTLVEGMRTWLEMKDYASLAQVKGLLSYKRCADPAAFERANYTQAISSYAAADDWTR
jgi:dihydroorotate dehydrogenase (fumarate)